MRRSTRSRFAVILTLAALAASLGASAAAPAFARDGDSERRLVIENRPGREGGTNRPTRTVDVSKLQPASGAERSYEPKLRRPTSAESPIVPRNPALLSAAPVPITTYTTATPATESTAFPGLSSSTIEPPDPWVAVGPEQVVQSVNTTVRITDRQGGGGIDYSLEDFFGITSFIDYDAEVFDPRVIYDSLHGRWIGLEVSFDCYNDPPDIDVGTGYLDIAISRSADARGVWDIFSIPFTDAVPDYPGIGTSTDKVVLSSNVFALTSGHGLFGCDIDDPFLGTELDVLAWSELIGAGSVTPQYIYSPVHFPNQFFSWRPALQTPATSATVYLVAEKTGRHVAYAQITGSPAGSGVATLSAISDLTTLGLVEGFDIPPPPAQPGSPGTIVDAVDQRPTDAVWQGNQLTFVSTYPCDPVGADPGNRDCVRVTELSTATSPPAALQDFLIAEEGADHYMGGIGYAGNGDLHVVWTRSSEAAGQYASSYTAYQRVTDAANTLSQPTPIAAGTGTYTGTRWGDFVGVAQDPQVPNAVWQANQYAGGGEAWGTRVSQLQTSGSSYVPIPPKRVVDSRFNVGVTGAFAVNVPKTFLVAGVSPIPPQAIAVTGNVTVVGQTAAGYVSITPTATSTPPSSTMNFPLGDIRANNFTVPLDAAGRLAAVYKASTTGRQTHVIVDITGYFLPGNEDAKYATIDPVRVMDTRPAPFHVGLIGQFTAGQTQTLRVVGGAIPAGATAITGNVTVVGQTAAGLLAVTPDPPTLPLASSTLNFPVGDTRANGLTADLNSSGDLSITFVSNTAGAKTHVLLDVTGYYREGSGGLLFYPLNPGRVMDSRPGVVLSGLFGVFSTGVPRELPVAGHWGAAGADAITGNLTVVGQTSGGFVSITPTLNASPTTSTLNFPLGDIRANGVTVPVNGSGTLWLVYKTTTAGRTTHLIVDLTGYFN